jgi:hypothetical protein
VPTTISTTRNIGSAKEDPPAGARNIKRLGEDTEKKASLGRMRKRRAQSYGHHPDRYIRQTQPVVESLMFGKSEIPVIIFGILFAMLFIFGAASPLQTGVYSEHRNYTDALQRAEDNK